MMRKVAISALALGLSGCSMMPAYQRPAPAVPAALPQGASYAALPADDGAVDAIGWRTFFTDARLQRVITTALAQNRDLRATVANVAAARAQYRVVDAARLPTITASPAVSRFHGSVGYTNGYGDSTGATSDAFGISGGVASFELDLWGRVRSLSRAALETWLASDEGRKSTQIALVSHVAQAWLTIGADADALGVARDTLHSRSTTLTVAQQRYAQGVGTTLEVAQAEVLTAMARSDVARYTTDLAQAKNALTLLAGAPVAEADLPGTLGAGDAVMPALPVGLTSAVLLRRPDVLSAEHQLIAANANIGAARAAMFPTISLTGLAGLASSSLGGLFNQGGVFNWGIAGSATQTLFDGGALRGNLAAARARHDAAVATYEGAVQNAFSDVANALARRGTIDDQMAAQQAYVASAEKAAAITDERYRNGVDAWLPALDAARTMYAARQSLVGVRLEKATNMVALYEVLGGGLKP
ncbi:efflux transporter outer membrane subunit [Novosphingobium sp.]|uniref:efflux transporter outer membrane subunit n=1 Tax=Novosphingobium sp. TaxID=1874826 RepID=UPI003D0B5B97